MISRRVVFLILTLAGIGAFSPVAEAQSAGNGFLFAAPKGSWMFRAGYDVASARSDLFSFTTDRLTLGHSAFSGPTADLELALRTGSRTDVLFAASYAGIRRGSEFRRFVDQAGNPIQQTTTFQRVPLTISLRWFPTSRGRSVGNFAWIPARVAPYVGAGGGMIWYRFQQSGDFIDFTDSEVFPARLGSAGWTPAGRGFAGLEYTLSPRLALTGQASYLWAKARLGNDFSNFDRIDLSGLSTTVGLSVTF